MRRNVRVSQDAPAGCALIAFLLWLFFTTAWIGFLVWAIYTLVSWVVTK